MRTMHPAAWTLSAIVAAGALAPQQAWAQTPGEGREEDGIRFELGVAAMYRPEYKGSNDYEVSPLPYVSFRYSRDERYIALQGPSLKANIVAGGLFEFGPLLSYERGRSDDIENLAVGRLGEIDRAVMAGAFLSKDIDLGADSGFQVGAEVLTDTGDANEGVMAKLEVGYHRRLADRWTVMVGASTTWADENYMQTYYGVTPLGAAASGLSAYTAGSGVENVELSAGLRFRVNDQWSVMGRASYQRLLDNAADSPVVRQGGSENQGQFGLVVIRAF